MVDHPLSVHNLSSVTCANALRELLDEGVTLTSESDSQSTPGETEILVAGRPSREGVEACSNLRMLIVPFAGVPEATRELMLDFPHVAVHNLHHNAAAAAELAIALFLAAAKRLIPADRALRTGDWSIRYADTGDLLIEGKTALVLGLGAVGLRIARACRGFGMKVLAIRRHPKLDQQTNVDIEVHGTDSLHAVLPAADALFIALPLTPATRGLLGARELALLPARSVLVNIARGPIVDEEALFDALSAGRIGAGLDAWYNYPRTADRRASTFPSAFPFHMLDNAVLSPHRGGAFNQPEMERLRIEHLARLLNAAARGEAVPNRVDVDAGY